MEYLFKSLLYLHVTAGFCSLVLFWIPVFTRKGGINHRKVGTWYVRLMWVVVATAAILSVKNLFVGNSIMAAFLGFISLITANPLWYSISVLKNKEKLSPQYKRMHMTFRICIIVCAMALVTYGVLLGGQGAAILMFIFGGLGLVDIPAAVKEIRTPTTQSQWFKDHLVGMCVSGIAAYTAFLVFGANRIIDGLLPGYWAIIPWVLPAVVGNVGIRLAVRKYKKQGMIA